MIYSQSYIRATWEENVCPAALKMQFIDKLEQQIDDETKKAMFRGRYFEWHLLGATRDGIEPKFEPNIKARYTTGSLGEKIPDYRPAAELELIELVEYARAILKNMGLDTNEGEKQVHLKAGDKEGHLDWITKDYMNPTRKAIVDVKWTGTKVDDRFIGWADFDSMQGERFQATHYIQLYKEARGEYVPYYFFVFGNSGWMRVIKVVLTEQGLSIYNTTVDTAKQKTANFEAQKWPARPSFNKCMKCWFLKYCETPAIVPAAEIFHI